RIRSGALQYAKAMQMHFRKDITNSEIFVAVLQEEGRGHSCLAQTVPRIIFPENMTIEEGEKLGKEPLTIMRTRLKEVENLVFNTDIRKNKENENYKKYMTSYGLENKNYCDIDLMALPN
ncbi:hypothetical protein CVV26_02890, partial [Candidatus Kuenenbacteria bacterium HGW-Kuenenbacteria-1]